MSSSNSAPQDEGSEAGQYIYKIVPSSPAVPLESGNGPQATLPEAYRLYSSDLDKRDGFVHMSTASQAPRTLKRFFPAPAASRQTLYLFKVAYADLENRQDLRMQWENTSGKPGTPWSGDDSFFAHIYLDEGVQGVNADGLAVMGGSRETGVAEVQSVVELVSEEAEEGWDAALVKVKEWLI